MYITYLQKIDGNPSEMEFYDKGLIAGIDLAIEGINIAILTHELTNNAIQNFREFQRILESTKKKYAEKYKMDYGS